MYWLLTNLPKLMEKDNKNIKFSRWNQGSFAKPWSNTMTFRHLTPVFTLIWDHSIYSYCRQKLLVCQHVMTSAEKTHVVDEERHSNRLMEFSNLTRSMTRFPWSRTQQPPHLSSTIFHLWDQPPFWRPSCTFITTNITFVFILYGIFLKQWTSCNTIMHF